MKKHGQPRDMINVTKLITEFHLTDVAVLVCEGSTPYLLARCVPGTGKRARWTTLPACEPCVDLSLFFFKLVAFRFALSAQPSVPRRAALASAFKAVALLHWRGLCSAGTSAIRTRGINLKGSLNPEGVGLCNCHGGFLLRKSLDRRHD